jgi:hypothetical protein
MSTEREYSMGTERGYRYSMGAERGYSMGTERREGVQYGCSMGAVAV